MKTKREMLHILIDALMDIEESGTKKELRLGYSTALGADFSFIEGNGSREYVIPDQYVYTGHPWNMDEQLNKALEKIEMVKTIPDSPEKVSLTLTMEKAKELGLIA